VEPLRGELQVRDYRTGKEASRVVEVARRDALSPLDEELRIVPAELGTMAGLIGAGLIAFEALG